MVFQVSHFYGYTYDYVMNLDNEVFQKAYDMITVIKHQDLLMSIQAASFPNSTKEGRNKMFNDVKKIAYPDFLNSVRAKKMTDAKSEMQRFFNGK